MDPNTQELVMGSAGASAGPPVYIEDVFSTWLYTGNGGTQTLTTGVDYTKDFLIWSKTRGTSGTAGYNNHRLVDSIRGAGDMLSSNLTDPQINPGPQYVSRTTSSITLQDFFNPNDSTTRALWTFRKAPKFFDVVTYTGTGSNRTVAHNLGSVPGCIIVKRTDAPQNWTVYHRSLGNTQLIRLESTNPAFTSLQAWNNTTPTSNEFTVGTGTEVNASGGTYVAYLFAHDAGGFGDSGNDNVIICGSVVANGSGQFPAVNLGWEPQWILSKRVDYGSNWEIVDNLRGMPVTTNSARLFPNNSNGESGFPSWSPTSTGFTNSTSYNAGERVIYIAIRRGPMKTPTDPTKVFNVVKTTTFSTGQIISGPPVVDLGWSKQPDGANPMRIFDRLRGAFGSNTQVVYPSSTTSEANENYWLLDQNNGYRLNLTIGGINYMHYMFSRAPKFLDIVTYTGNSNSALASQTLSHNLGVKPELIIIKSRSNSTSGQWITGILFGSSSYSVTYLSNNQVFYNLPYSSYPLFGSSEPTATQFGCGNDSTASSANNTNESGVTYVAYLFASCPGVSKIGTYTGTGTTLQINCGFTAGARFILIKRTDAFSSDWYLWDSARGISVGADPYFLLNSSNTEVNGTDYITPYAPGFEITSSAPSAINGNGGTFFYLAIA